MTDDKNNKTPKEPPPPKRWPPQGSMPGPQKPSRSMALWIGLLIVFFLAFLLFNSGREREWPLTYSQFITEINNSNISSIKIKGLEVRGTLMEEIVVPTGGEGTTIKSFKVILPAEDKDLPEKILRPKRTRPELKTKESEKVELKEIDKKIEEILKE